MTMIYKYKQSTVEVFDLSILETEDTVSVPRWALHYIASGQTLGRSSGYLVKKPDNSISIYSEEELNKEFELDKDSV